jgi:MFS family permease
MAEHGSESISSLVRSVLADTRELLREELALARAEVREEIAGVRSAAMAFAGAALVALLGTALLSVAIGGAIAYWLGWPNWAGYGAIAILMLIGAAVLLGYGRRQVTELRALPATRKTLKENVEWIQNKSGQK